MGFSVQDGLFPGVFCPRGVSVCGGLCLWGSLSSRVSVQQVSVQEVLCPGGVCRGVFVRGFSVPGVSDRYYLDREPPLW